MSLLAERYARAMCASETTYKTDQINADLIASKAIKLQRFSSISIEPSATPLQPEIVSPTHDLFKMYLNAQGCAVNITANIGEVGAVDEPFDFDPLLIAANAVRTVDAGVGVNYAFRTLLGAGATVVKHINELESENTRIQIATGVRGNISWAYAANAIPQITFTGMGCSYTEAYPSDAQAFFDDSTNPPTPLLDNEGNAISYSGGVDYSTQAEAQASIVLTVNGVEWQVSEFNLDMGWSAGASEILKIPTYNAINNTRDNTTAPNGTIVLVDGAIAFNAFLSQVKASQAYSATVALTIGSRTYTHTLPAFQVGVYTEGASAGAKTWSIPFFCQRGPAGEDSVQWSIA